MGLAAQEAARTGTVVALPPLVPPVQAVAQAV
jgi:hypothetical protein